MLADQGGTQNVEFGATLCRPGKRGEHGYCDNRFQFPPPGARCRPASCYGPWVGASSDSTVATLALAVVPAGQAFQLVSSSP